jgi:hypothetical protein
VPFVEEGLPFRRVDTEAVAGGVGDH